jgi:hypothetical protein
MSTAQRRYFLFGGLAVTVFPVALLLELLATARSGDVHLNGSNFLFIFGMIPLVVLIFGTLGIGGILEGAIGRCRITVGIPSRDRWASHTKRRIRSVLMDGRSAPFPARDYEAVISSGRRVRIYRSRIWGGFLGWEYVDPQESAR